jgi:hypothetical protein
MSLPIQAEIYLDDLQLPGCVTSVRVEQAIDYEDLSTQKTDGRDKTPRGWKDRTFYVEFTAVSLAALLTVSDRFRERGSDGAPKVFKITNNFFNHLGVSRVLWVKADVSTRIVGTYNLVFKEFNGSRVVAQEVGEKDADDKALAAAEAADEISRGTIDESALMRYYNRDVEFFG